MYVVSVSTAKNHQICSRVCLKGCCLIQKLPSQNLSNNKKKKWWNKSFKKVFGKYLLLTNTISSGVLMTVGDLIQQEIEYVKYGNHKNFFDWKRNSVAVVKVREGVALSIMVNMGIVGTLQGPLAHFFYQILDRYFPGVKMTTVMKKIFLDQTIASPLFICLFFGGMNYLGNANFEESKAELKEKFWIVYAVCCVCGFRLIVQFGFLPSLLIFIAYHPNTEWFTLM